ncbi:MAG: WbqC family protein [Nostoc sp.]|uniref:WbqC family protein n=1 Tax=Nostoc sp. TaxID=1180 RepID=UPI002FF6B918
MIVSINQPAYLPWLGYFHRIAISNLHIVLDNVQFEKNSFINRNKVKTANSWSWLTVPVKTKNKFGVLPIKSLEIDNSSNWKIKHWQTICQNYQKAPYFQEHALFFESIYQQEWYYLSPLCYEINSYLLKVLGITTPIIFSSEMNPTGMKNELIIDLCQKVGTKIYLSGILGKNYIREELFQKAAIQVIYQNYCHPEYPQFRGKNFEPYMSVLDLLFNCGTHSSHIMNSNQAPI